MDSEDQKDWDERSAQRNEFGISNLTRKLVVKFIKKKNKEGGQVSKEGLLGKLKNRKK